MNELSRNFGKKTNPQTISIIARRTRAFVVFAYALHGIDSYALAPRVRIREVCQLPDLQTYSLSKIVRFIGHHIKLNDKSTNLHSIKISYNTLFEM